MCSLGRQLLLRIEVVAPTQPICKMKMTYLIQVLTADAAIPDTCAASANSSGDMSAEHAETDSRGARRLLSEASVEWAFEAARQADLCYLSSAGDASKRATAVAAKSLAAEHVTIARRISGLEKAAVAHVNAEVADPIANCVHAIRRSAVGRAVHGLVLPAAIALLVCDCVC